MNKKTFNEISELAQIYYEDGAPFSAARVLREFADKLEQIGKE